jgi:hypothetical protein
MSVIASFLRAGNDAATESNPCGIKIFTTSTASPTAHVNARLPEYQPDLVLGKLSAIAAMDMAIV